MLSKTVKAKYKNGVLELLERLDLPEGVEITISFEPLEVLSEGEKKQRFLSAAGGWKDLLDCKEFIKDVYESRKIRTRAEVKL